MQRRFTLIAALLFISASSLLGQINYGTLKGKVTDKDKKEPIPFAVVKVYLNGNLVTGGSTDIDGQYTIKPIDPGTYDVEFSIVGYQSLKIQGIPISAGAIKFANGELTEGVEIKEVQVVAYKVPLIDKDGGASGGRITKDDFKNMPSRSALGVAATVAGVVGTSDGGFSIRGARTGSTWVYIDGVKVRGSAALPKSAVEEVSVITGGVPANIGDVTGGVVNISLRSASRTFTGGVEAISSGFKTKGGWGDRAVGLDKYGYNLLEGSLSGPLLWKKNEKGEKVKPIVGFFVTANYTDILDPSPAFGGNYRIKKDAYDQLLADPIRQNVQPDGTVNGALYNAAFTGSNSFEKTLTNQNIRNRQLNLVGKLDFNLSETVMLTLGGTFARVRAHNFDYSNMLMNWDNNNQNTNTNWRAYARFSQRFKNTDEKSSSNLKNVYYSVMVDYSQTLDKNEDDTHKDKLFRYGHVGNFDVIRGNTYSFDAARGYYRQTGVQDLTVFFTPSQYNPDLAAVTSQYFRLFERNQFISSVFTGVDGTILRDPNRIFVDGNLSSFISNDPYSSLTKIQGGNGLINGFGPPDVYNLWSYIGSQNNTYSKVINNQFRVTAMGSADIGDHALQIGFEFEQRNDAGFAVAPIGLWQLARQYANAHLTEFANRPDIVGYDSTIVQVGNSRYVYFPRLVGNNQFEFDYNLRTSLGLNPRGTDIINVYNLDPSQLSLSMFGASDLLNQGNNVVTYYGFDHTGKRVRGGSTIDDFFSQTYTLGNGTYNTRPIAPFQPVYISGYIMDKFAFDDLIFNLGLRVDRYDANQFVPKDPYVISEAYSASETDFSKFGVSRPSNIGDNYVVYVNDVKNPTSITGYRDGDQWYNARGQRIDSPDAIISAGGGRANPYLKVDPKAPLTKNAFKQYTPAVNVMPRVNFSFPISDEALFFAHYDILTQRPTESNRFNPIDFLYMSNRNVLLNNPNLRPERTVDYALGFQQILSRTSSLKIEAFYREMRDMIQVRSYTGAYPSTYRTFGNLDFGTVKGLTLTYDLRRTGNLTMKTSYTLQFADGTGSTTQTQLALINAGLPNLRTIAPVNYDVRHRIVTTLDYRFAGGADYNGPIVKNHQILANAGVNFIANLASGTPYTPQRLATPITGELGPTTQGSINGARLPWQFSLDMQVDKNFGFRVGEDKEKGKGRALNLNVYVWVTNLLNTRNIIGVYRFTGTPNDDGYLSSAQFQTTINSQTDPSSFRNYYSMYVNNPYNLGAPRQIRLGMRLDF
jgi:hypothetical protein